MNLIFFFIFTFWFIRLVINILSYAHLWFVKEYRFDRMLIHLKTKQGKKILFPPIRKPPVSPKSFLLTLSLLTFVLTTLVLLPIQTVLKFILADLSLFPLSFVLVGIFKLPTIVYHKIKIKQAQAKLYQHLPMKTIGITGSYGKTSTKEFLSTILENKFKVLKTQASKNAAIGIAEVVLSKLRPEHEVFIAEMGAYKLGEISQMTEMVKPEIGIITAINLQHQDLFGSLATTMKAKYELIAGLSGKKTAIMNADNNYVRQMAQWAIKDGVAVWSVGLESQKIAGAQNFFTIKKIRGDLKGITFELVYGKNLAVVKAPVLGKHQATNISLAIAGAVATGMRFEEAVKTALSLRPFLKTMQSLPGINGSIFINDTFNNNPDAAIAAIDVLNKAAGRKFLVFQPMIELGSFARISHESVGEYAAKICDEIILTNNNFFEFFIAGAKRVNPDTLVKVMTPVQAGNHLFHILKKGDIVLFKGKESELVLKQLVNLKNKDE